MKRIRITFANGQATVKAIGYKGAACLDATREYEQALGTVTSDVKTAEFRQVEADVEATRTAER